MLRKIAKAPSKKDRKPKKVGRLLFEETTDFERAMDKFEFAVATGANDDLACFHAGILPSTLYLYQKRHPEYKKRKRMLRDKVMLWNATQTVNKAAKKDVRTALTVLERLMPEKWQGKQVIETKQEHTHNFSEEAAKRLGPMKP